jgi:hypothetical protein
MGTHFPMPAVLIILTFKYTRKNKYMDERSDSQVQIQSVNLPSFLNL